MTSAEMTSMEAGVSFAFCGAPRDALTTIVSTSLGVSACACACTKLDMKPRGLIKIAQIVSLAEDA